VNPATAGWDAPRGTFDGSGFRRPAKGERPGQHREPCTCQVCTGARRPCLLPDNEEAVERLAAALREVYPELVIDSAEAWPDTNAIIAALREGGQR